MTATGFVGGYAGAYIENALKPFGIKSAFYLCRLQKADPVLISGMKLIKFRTEFLEPGFTLTEEDFAGFEEKFCNLVKEAKVVAMSGSVPKGLDGTAYQRLIKIVKEAGIPVILDTSGKTS